MSIYGGQGGFWDIGRMMPGGQNNWATGWMNRNAGRNAFAGAPGGGYGQKNPALQGAINGMRGVGGGNQSFGAPQEINGDDFASTSQNSSMSALPDWAQNFLSGVVGKHGDKAFKGYNQALAGMKAAVQGVNDAPELIEKQRQLQAQQYGRDINAPTNRAVQDAIARAMGKGVGNSSMVSETIGGVGRELGGAAQQAHQASNLWAGSANLQNLMDRVSANNAFQQANAGRAGMMGELAGMSRYTQSQGNSYTPNFNGMGFSPY